MNRKLKTTFQPSIRARLSKAIFNLSSRRGAEGESKKGLGRLQSCCYPYSPQLIKLNTFVCLWPIRNHAQAHLNMRRSHHRFVFLFYICICISSSFCRRGLPPLRLVHQCPPCTPLALSVKTSVIFSQFRCVAVAWHENSMDWTRAHPQCYMRQRGVPRGDGRKKVRTR